MLAYSMMGRSNVLYVVMSVFLLFPQCVDVRSFKRLSVFFLLLGWCCLCRWRSLVWGQKLSQGW